MKIGSHVLYTAFQGARAIPAEVIKIEGDDIDIRLKDGTVLFVVRKQLVLDVELEETRV